jgi:protein tyrosine phosphatase (PTP) superfamily phosphohydrolase (DUF442 family)
MGYNQDQPLPSSQFTLPKKAHANMDDQPLQAIYNYRRVSDCIGTSGMPTEAQLAEIARAGFEVVINLDQLDSRYALPDERRTVEAVGMTYHQIPVVWDNPTHQDLVGFFAAMARYADQRVFVHCVANYRVTTFMTLYGILRLGWQRDEAMLGLLAMWQPNATWQQFIDAELSL